MHLKAMPLRRGLAIIAHGNRQEMILDIGIIDPRRRADKGAGLKLVRGPKPLFGEQPLRPDQRLAPEIPVFIERDRQLRGELEIDLHMVLQIGPDAGPVCDNLNPMRRQMARIANARQHQQLRRVDRRGRENHLCRRRNHLDPAAALDLDPGRAAVFDHHFPRQTAQHRAVAAFLCRPQIGIGGRPALTFENRGLHRAKTFLLLAIVIGGHRIARLLPRRDKGVEQRVLARPAADVQRPFVAAPGRIAAIMAPVPLLHPLEIGQNIGIAPARRALLGPMIIIARMAPHIDHAIDAGRSADHLAARCGQPPPVQMRFRLRLKAPVVNPHIHRIGQRARHLDERPDIAAAMLDHDHAFARLGQPVGHRRAARARPHDHIIRPHPTHPSASRSSWEKYLRGSGGGKPPAAPPKPPQ